MTNREKMLKRDFAIPRRCQIGAQTPTPTTIIVSLLVGFLLMIFTQSAQAQLDLSVTGFGRTLPRSAYLESELGYGYSYWGSGGGDNIMYGYIRPFANVATSGNYNAIATGVEFYPISFLGLRGGAEYSNNSYKFAEYDCVLYNCLGTRYKAFLEGNVAIGNKSVFGRVKMRQEKWSQAHELAGDFIDPASGLAAKANGDAQSLWIIYMGISVNDRWKVLVGNRYGEMANIKGISQYFYLGGLYSWAPVTIGAGISTFKSSLKERGGGIFLTATWEIYPSIALH